MTKVLLVEDEPLAVKRLTRLINELAPDFEIYKVIDSVEETVAFLDSEEVDLIFMDIHLSDGNSFSVFDKVKNPVRTPIIFSTAYDQYAIRAFKLNSVDYLLKPVEKEELAQAIEKFRSQQVSPGFDLDALRTAITGTEKTYQKRFIVSSGEKIKSVKIDDVAYFFGQQKYVFLVTHDNRRHIIDYTLTQLEDLLDPEEYFRINRQFIIAFDAIQQMHTWSKSRVKIDLAPEPDREAIVSIDRSGAFKRWLDR
ncbi:MAG: LytR/AlgR family response regulator transcription factor [Bacteroidia bacterium]